MRGSVRSYARTFCRPLQSQKRSDYASVYAHNAYTSAYLSAQNYSTKRENSRHFDALPSLSTRALFISLRVFFFFFSVTRRSYVKNLSTFSEHLPTEPSLMKGRILNFTLRHRAHGRLKSSRPEFQKMNYVFVVRLPKTSSNATRNPVVSPPRNLMFSTVCRHTERDGRFIIVGTLYCWLLKARFTHTDALDISPSISTNFISTTTRIV